MAKILPANIDDTMLSDNQRLALQRRGVYVPAVAGKRAGGFYNPGGAGIDHGSRVGANYNDQLSAAAEQRLAEQMGQAYPAQGRTAGGQVGAENPTIAAMRQQAAAMTQQGLTESAARAQRIKQIAQGGGGTYTDIRNIAPAMPTNQTLANQQVADDMFRANTGGAEPGSLEHYRQSRVAEAAGLKTPSAGSLFNRNAVRPDADMFSSPGLVNPAERQVYQQQALALEQSVARRMAQNPNAFKTLEEADRFIQLDPNYSELIGTSASSLAQKLVGKTAPALYQEWQLQGKVDAANKQAQERGSDARYEIDPVTNQIREAPLTPEQEHSAAMRKAGTDISTDEAMQMGMPVIQLGDKLIGPADRRYKSFTKQMPVYQMEPGLVGKDGKPGPEVYSEDEKGKKIVSGYKTVALEGANVYKPPVQPAGPVTPGKGFITVPSTGQVVTTGGVKPVSSITDQQGKVITPATAKVSAALQDPTLTPAERQLLEGKMPPPPPSAWKPGPISKEPLKEAFKKIDEEQKKKKAKSK